MRTYKKYLSEGKKGSFEDKLAYFDDKIKELKQAEKDADDFEEDYLRKGFKDAYKNLQAAFKKQRDAVAATIGTKKR
jgi:hypothetical protein